VFENRVLREIFGPKRAEVARGTGEGFLIRSFTGSPACYVSELASEIMNPFRYFDRTPWTGYWPIARPSPTRKGTTEKN
jgi:hypothetical protein